MVISILFLGTVLRKRYVCWMEHKLVDRTLDSHGDVVLQINRLWYCTLCVRWWLLIIVLSECSLFSHLFSHRRTLTNGMEVAITDMDKDTKTIAMPQLLRTLICSTVAMVGMEITSSLPHNNRSSSSKEDTCRFEVLFTLPWPLPYRISRGYDG